MTLKEKAAAHVATSFAQGCITATVEIAAPPERVFRALASEEIVEWWVRPGVFETKEWSGDVRAGGRWRASGLSQGNPWALEGGFLEVDPPHRLVHTWHFAGAPQTATTVTYDLEPIEGGTRLVLRHSGFPTQDASTNASMGWETSLQRLAEIFSPQGVSAL